MDFNRGLIDTDKLSLINCMAMSNSRYTDDIDGLNGSVNVSNMKYTGI